MRRFQTAFLATLVSVGSIASLAPEAAGQCSMTQTAVSGAWQLCADGASSAWQWTGPGGYSATTACITVSTPGTYVLREWDGLNGLWGMPCSWSFATAPNGPGCSIAGDDSVCAGESTMWCTPSGAEMYSWTSPSGRHGSSNCTLVDEAGEYVLVVTDAAGVSDTCRRTLIVKDCSTPRIGAVCPLPARSWSRSCGLRSAHVSAGDFARVAAQVDDRSAALSFGGTASGLCTLLRPRRHGGGEATVARRHFAAVLANLSAAELGVLANDGHAVGLEPSLALVGIRGVLAGTTLGDWVATTESRLLELSTGSTRHRRGHDDYRRIARQARAINRSTAGCAPGASALLDDLADDDEDDDLLAAVPVAVPGGSESVSRLPSNNPMSVRWSLSRAEAVELAIVDVTGRRIRRLASGLFTAGTHEFTWDGRDDDGRALRSGAYFVSGRVGAVQLAHRLFLLR